MQSLALSDAEPAVTTESPFLFKTADDHCTKEVSVDSDMQHLHLPEHVVTAVYSLHTPAVQNERNNTALVPFMFLPPKMTSLLYFHVRTLPHPIVCPNARSGSRRHPFPGGSRLSV